MTAKCNRKIKKFPEIDKIIPESALGTGTCEWEAGINGVKRGKAGNVLWISAFLCGIIKSMERHWEKGRSPGSMGKICVKST